MVQIRDDSIGFRLNIIDNLSNDQSTLRDYSVELMKALRENTAQKGIDWFLDLLRVSSCIPEIIKADSSEEKRYSKYTDTLLAFALEKIGLKAAVLDARGDAADVEAVGPGINMVGDAKVFRLSRTAKNQKDFKVDAMDKWKGGKPHALLACPIYQLPARQSQIYNSAEMRNVCVFSYSHLCVLINIASNVGNDVATSILKDVFENSFTLLNPSKSAANYWLAVNGSMHRACPEVKHYWEIEKRYIEPTISVGKAEGLKYYQSERERIMSLPHDEAIQELINLSGVDAKIETIRSVCANGLFDIEETA